MKKKDMEEEFKHFINPVFELGETVYLKADTLQYPRVIIAYYVTIGLHVTYELRGVEEVGTYNDFEISREKNIELSMSHEED